MLLSAFRARTGRNQPSNAKFIFGPATWLRGDDRPRGLRCAPRRKHPMHQTVAEENPDTDAEKDEAP